MGVAVQRRARWNPAAAVDDGGRIINARMFEFVVNLYGALEEAIYDKLRFGRDFRAAVDYLRNVGGLSSFRGPIFSWLMEGGLARVAEGFASAGLTDAERRRSQTNRQRHWHGGWKKAATAWPGKSWRAMATALTTAPTGSTWRPTTTRG